MLRELDMMEVTQVAGGNGGPIVVTANVGNYGTSAGGHGGEAFLGGLGAFQGADFSGLGSLATLTNGDWQAELSTSLAAYLKELGFEDNNGDGWPETAPIIVSASPGQVAAAQDGSFFGGMWAATLVGASVGGGGGLASAYPGFGFGGGVEIGFSTDSGEAGERGDNSEVMWPGPYINIDVSPLTIEAGFNWGIFIPIGSGIQRQ